MKLRIDRKADALYLRLADSKVIESEQIAPGVIVDFDNADKVVGVEVLSVSQRLRRVARGKRRSSHAAGASLVREKPAKKYGA
jgi:uncharacterized protein YuzE